MNGIHMNARNLSHIKTVEEVTSWFYRKISSISDIPAELIDEDEELTLYLSSVEAMEMMGELEDWLGCRLEPTSIYHYPTIMQLSKFLVRQQVFSETETEREIA